MGTPLIGSLDREVALSRVGGDLELLKEIAVLFLENYEAWLGELREAAARGDAKVVENTAHGLKGSVANFGARKRRRGRSSNLETLGRSRDLTDVSRSLAALESALAALRPNWNPRKSGTLVVMMYMFDSPSHVNRNRRNCLCPQPGFR